MLDFKAMTKKSDFQYERDTIKIFLHFLKSKSLCITKENEGELFKVGDVDLIEMQEEFIHECVKR